MELAIVIGVFVLICVWITFAMSDEIDGGFGGAVKLFSGGIAYLAGVAVVGGAIAAFFML